MLHYLLASSENARHIVCQWGTEQIMSKLMKITVRRSVDRVPGIALVTGAARGIGREIALRLADDGFDVAVNDLSGTAELEEVAKAIESKGRKSLQCFGDVSVEQDVVAMIEAVVAAMGSLDVMVANAGILTVHTILDVDPDEFDRTLRVNVRGVMLCYKHAAKQMVAQGRGGRIIAASSVAGKKGYPYLFSYSTSKFAVRGMTQSAAAALGKYGITVNAYAPGGVDTRMLDDLDERFLPVLGPGGARKNLAASGSVGRTGVPSDVANVVSFLASKESSFVTGQSICVDGGTYFD
ncbi:acetoin reductase family protein [Auriscalpium vulgare]|uniref:Acetoin reductase family protein n=1 Tax=Auriscalpium vulgare TaxID=40419 RepID=A0ACB8RZ03_9AGAM|nr:acetoin reductase family protein [Auriscalpium vulgare]